MFDKVIRIKHSRDGALCGRWAKVLKAEYVDALGGQWILFTQEHGWVFSKDCRFQN
jgi:hypothetical protein